MRGALVHGVSTPAWSQLQDCSAMAGVAKLWGAQLILRLCKQPPGFHHVEQLRGLWKPRVDRFESVSLPLEVGLELHLRASQGL